MNQEFPKTEAEYRKALEAMPEGEQKAGFKQLMDTFKPWDQLHPELAKWIVNEGSFTSLKHPLVYDVVYSPGIRDGHLNEIFQWKTERLKEYTQSKEWRKYVFTHERAWRLHAFMAICDLIEDDCEYWGLVGGIWTDSENIWQNYTEWEDVLSSERGCRESMMDEGEQIALNLKPEEFTIYRGYNLYDGGQPPFGFSWTLDKERAVWFANRFASHRGAAWVAKATVRKENVIAHFTGRGEEEIVVMPENVEILDRWEV